MSRRNWTRVARLEKVLEDRLPVSPWLVLFPGQEAPDGYKGDMIRIVVVDGRRTA